MQLIDLLWIMTGLIRTSESKMTWNGSFTGEMMMSLGLIIQSSDRSIEDQCVQIPENGAASPLGWEEVLPQEEELKYLWIFVWDWGGNADWKTGWCGNRTGLPWWRGSWTKRQRSQFTPQSLFPSSMVMTERSRIHRVSGLSHTGAETEALTAASF